MLATCGQVPSGELVDPWNCVFRPLWSWATFAFFLSCTSLFARRRPLAMFQAGRRGAGETVAVKRLRRSDASRMLESGWSFYFLVPISVGDQGIP